MNKKYLVLPYVFWLALFIIVPVVLILIYSFKVETEMGVVFSFANYKKFFDFSDPLYMSVLWRSIVLAFLTTVVCLVVAYPLAMILNSKEISNKGIIVLLVILPMWMNSLLRTYAWLPLLENTGLIPSLLARIGIKNVRFLYNDGAVIFGMVYNFFPFMVLPIYNTLNKIDSSILEAAQDLGASKTYTFKKVIFPLSMPGVATGILMVFMPALTTFVITRLLGGGKVTLIGNVIEDQFTRTRDLAFGSALSVVLMAIILVCLSFMSKKDAVGKGGIF